MSRSNCSLTVFETQMGAERTEHAKMEQYSHGPWALQLCCNLYISVHNMTLQCCCI